MKEKTPTYMGYRASDYTTAYAKYFDETIVPISESVQNGLKNSPFPAKTLPSITSATYLHTEGYQNVETGYSLETDGSIHVAVLTTMPQVAPQMWDWWFGWHGCLANRYKLWHPKAHKDAQWKDGDDRVGYIGRTSIIEEYIGQKLEKAAIQFINPTELGFKASELDDKTKVVYICARIGYAQLPIDFGWLVHQVRSTEGGAEMRSRFWVGGSNIQIRGRGVLAQWLSKILQKLVRLPEQQGKDLLTHCSEEMNHLAAFLPKIYQDK